MTQQSNMCYQSSVLDRALVSDEGGGLDAPGTDIETIESHNAQLPGSDLKQTVIAAQRLIERTHAEMVLLVREPDRRHLLELDERLSTVGWLTRHTQTTAAQASGTVKTARDLGHMPTVIEAALKRAAPHRSLQMLTWNRHKIEFVDHESVFGDIATYLSAAGLHHGATHTTSSTGQTEEKPTSPTPNSSAAHTTQQRTNKNDPHPTTDGYLFGSPQLSVSGVGSSPGGASTSEVATASSDSS